MTTRRTSPFRPAVLSYYSAAFELDRPLCHPRRPVRALAIGLALVIVAWGWAYW